MKTKLVLFVTLLFVQISCTTRIVDCTIISTKSFSIDDSGNYQKLDTRIEGEDLSHMVIFIPLGLPDVKEAIDNTIEQVPGCVGLADAVMYHTWFYIPYIYGQFRYIIEGTPIVRKGAPTYVPKKKAESNEPIENTANYGH